METKTYFKSVFVYTPAEEQRYWENVIDTQPLRPVLCIAASGPDLVWGCKGDRKVRMRYVGPEGGVLYAQTEVLDTWPTCVTVESDDASAGGTAALGCSDGSVRIFVRAGENKNWDAAPTALVPGPPDGHPGPGQIISVAIAGPYVVAADDQMALMVWNVGDATARPSQQAEFLTHYPAASIHVEFEHLC